MRFVTWNMRRAKANSSAWTLLGELNPDIAALQEVVAIPEYVKEEYVVHQGIPVTKHGNPQKFSTVTLIRDKSCSRSGLVTSRRWITDLLIHFNGNIIVSDIEQKDGSVARIVNAYSPAWPVPKALLADIDVTGVKLRQNPNVWMSDILTAAVSETLPLSDNVWIIAGDFNSCISFDLWKGGPRGNQEWIDRMDALGLVECLSFSNGGDIVPTFKGPRYSEPKCQIDKIFATRQLFANLERCFVGDEAKVLGNGLSDHLPIIADFKLGME